MKKITISWLHLLLAIVAFLLSSPILKGEEKPEIIGYVLKPSNDVHCQIQIEIVESYGMGNIPIIQKEETLDILMDRIVFEETNYWGVNEIFYVDNKPYILIRIPYTGHWYGKEN
tara:strand:- start:39 stop:383 length:345 start_codon:yes stop_codon:yes gene_type:complete